LWTQGDLSVISKQMFYIILLRRSSEMKRGVILILLSVTICNISFSEPVPAEVIFAPPRIEGVRISPDGSLVSYLAKDKSGVVNIFVKSAGKNDDRAVIEDLKEDILSYEWSFLKDRILFLKKTESGDAVHLYLFDLKSGIMRDLTPFRGISARYIFVDPRLPESAACGIEFNKRGRFDLFGINLKNGAVEEIAQVPENIVDLRADIYNRLFLATSVDRRSLKKLFYIKTQKSDKFEEMLSIGSMDEFRFIDFSSDGKYIYALSNMQNKYTSLVKFDLESRREVEVVIQSERSDVDELYFNYYQKLPIAVGFDFMKREIKVIDANHREDITFLEKFRKGIFTIHSVDLSDKRWIVSYEAYEMPKSFYVYERDSRKATLLFLENPALEKYKPIKAQPFTIKFGESEKLLLFVTLPPEEAENFPVIINLYNPENKKIGQRFDPVCQFFVSRGFGCIAFNYSGIYGFGKDFYAQGYSKEGLKRQTEELITVIKWAIDRNIANPQQVTILSGPQGFLQSINVILNNPDMIHTAILIDPIFSLRFLKENLPLYEYDRLKGEIGRILNNQIDYLNQLKSLSIPLVISLEKNSSLYDYKKVLDDLMEIKKAGKDVSILSYSRHSPLNLIDIFFRVEQMLSRFYNVESIKEPPNLKIEVDVR